MSRMLQYPESPIDAAGLNERISPHTGGILAPNEARLLDELRPIGGSWEKVKGSQLHSNINFECASRISNLIRFSTEGGTTAFLAVAWRSLFRYTAGVWEPVMQDSRNSAKNPPNYLLIPNYSGNWFIWNDSLYYTDGYNAPIKFNLTAHGTSANTDYNANGTTGTWGLNVFSGTLSPLRTVTQAAGSLGVGDWNYYASLYDSTRELTGNVGTVVRTHTLGAIRNIWVHIDGNAGVWNDTNNYDYENEFADKIKIWRDPTLGVATPRRLAGTILKGLIATGTGTFADLGATGELTDATQDFVALGVIAGYAVQFGATYYQITVVAPTVLTLVNEDGGAYTGTTGAQTYRVWGGFIDSDTDLTSPSAEIYFGDDTTLPANERDHSKPPNCKYCLMVGERTYRALVAGNPTHPNRIYYSWDNTPDYFFDPDVAAGDWLDVEPNDGDAITALVRFQGRVYVFKNNSVGTLNVDGAPSEWTFTSKVLKVGAIDQSVIADCDGLLVWASKHGVYAFDGGSLRNISHSESGSNIIQTWAKIASAQFPNARAVYHRARREYWLAINLDDERGLYNSALAGLGDGTAYSPDLWGGTDNPLVSRNNITLAWRVETEQWFRMPHHVDTTAWAVFDKQGDFNEIYRGAWGAAVIREDVEEGAVSTDGDAGVVTSGTNRTLTKEKSHKTWVANEWIGGTVYLRYGQSDEEAREIIGNTTDTLTIGGSWASNAALNDVFQITIGEGTLIDEDGTDDDYRAYETDTATGGASTSLRDTSPPSVWSIGELTGCILVNVTAGEWCEVLTNTVDNIVGKDGTFNGLADVWTVNPQAGDTYELWRSIRDTTKAWTINEHAGRKVFLRSGATAEFATITRNTPTALQCESFNGVGATTDWTVAPSGDDFKIFDLTIEQQAIGVLYRTGMMHFGSMSSLKAFIDLFLRVYGTGTLDVSWTIDGAKSGSLTLTLSQAADVWGTYDWGATDSSTVLTWSEAGATVIESLNFDDTAEGFFLELEFSMTTAQSLQIFLWSVGYHRHTGNRWSR